MPTMKQWRSHSVGSVLVHEELAEGARSDCSCCELVEQVMKFQQYLVRVVTWYDHVQGKNSMAKGVQACASLQKQVKRQDYHV